MKKILSLLLAFSIMLSLCACAGNFGSVNLNDPISLPADGEVKEATLRQIRAGNAIGIFSGESGGFHYEWTVFGSDITEPKTVNFAVTVTEAENGDILLSLSQPEAFGFSALLSVYLEKSWNALSATAYAAEEAVASVSLTGSGSTVLNVTLDGSVSSLVIRPDALPETLPAEANPETAANAESEGAQSAASDSYLSAVTDSDEQVYTDGKDQYLTDPVPEGMPQPVEPEEQQIDTDTALTCTFSIECSTILNNLELLDPAKLEMVPSGGVILSAVTVEFFDGESVYDVLQRVCQENGIHMEAEWTPMYNSAYIEGIHNLYEFDCGALSGWMYKVNGWYPNYGCSRYQLKDGDVVEWRYTCDLGSDVGGAYAVGG